jgi:hypothetical protein
MMKEKVANFIIQEASIVIIVFGTILVGLGFLITFQTSLDLPEKILFGMLAFPVGILPIGWWASKTSTIHLEDNH